MKRGERLGLALVTALAGFAAAAPAQVISARVGGELAGSAGSYIDVPVTLDMSGAPGKKLAGYRMVVNWDPAALSFSNTEGGTFASPTTRTDSIYYGQLRLTALLPAGADGVVTLFVMRFYVYDDTSPTAITIAFDELTGPAPAFEDLLPYLTVENGTFCKEIGTWGDLDGDGAYNSRDALITLSAVVGLPVDSLLITAALADVDGDGSITSRDALIILSYAVGLPVTGFRIGLKAAGACATGSATTLVIEPDSIELQVGQVLPPIVRAFDPSGREVPLSTLIWRSTSSAVAAWQEDYYEPGVSARSPGVAVLTAEMGPGIKATLKVVVIERRRNWYVDIARLNAPLQTGSARYPFGFIGDAMDDPNAKDGDTVRVAPGIYEEEISSYVSVVLLGDSINRPVIDPRGSPYYSGYENAIYMGTAAATAQVEHFVLRGGGVYMEGHDNIVRNVRFEDITSYEVIEIYSQPFVPFGSPPTGAALAERNLGRVVIENVVVDGFQDNGIYVDQGDSVFVRNNTITRDSPFTSYCSQEGLAIWDANYSEVVNNVVTNACEGIIVEQELGKTVISRNRVTGMFRAGIEAGVPVVRLDHNVVRDGTFLNYAAQNYGIYVYEYYSSDSVFSVGDSIINVGYRGMVVDTARSTVIDSLVIDGTGLDSSYTASGLIFLASGGLISLTHSHIGNTGRDGDAVVACGNGLFTSRRNRISQAGRDGITTDCSYYYGYPVDSVISVQDTVVDAVTGINPTDAMYVRVDSADMTGRPGSAGGVHVYNIGRLVVRDSRIRSFGYGVFSQGSGRVEVRGNAIVRDSAGVYLESSTDSAVVVGNTVDSSYGDGIALWIGTRARVDSNVVRGGAYGIWLDTMTDSVFATGNTIDSTASGGLSLKTGPARVVGNNISRTGTYGLEVIEMSDSAVVTGNTINGSALDGIIVRSAGSLIRADSNRVTNSGMSGLVFYLGANGRLTRNRFQNNGSYGVGIDNSLNATSPSLANNIFQGNVLAGVNNSSYPNATMDADSNYWGDANGPRCNIAVTFVDCSLSVAGDSVISAGITFTPFLTSPPSGVPAAPRRPLLTASRGFAAAAPVSDATRVASDRATVQPRPRGRPSQARPQAPLARPDRGRARPTPSRKPFPMSWQRGREPSPPRPAATQTN